MFNVQRIDTIGSYLAAVKKLTGPLLRIEGLLLRVEGPIQELQAMFLTSYHVVKWRHLFKTKYYSTEENYFTTKKVRM